MAKRNRKGVPLPAGVHAVKKGNKTHYYWAPGRGTAAAGKRVKIGTDPLDPTFWSKLRGLMNVPGNDQGTFAVLIAEYLMSPEFQILSDSSKTNYRYCFNIIKQSAGDRPVRELETPDVYQLRDAMSNTPAKANKIISVLKSLVDWSIRRGYRKDNPVIGVRPLKMENNGGTPWPEEAFTYIDAHAPEMLWRVVYLGRATGQRQSDLLTMAPANLVHDGINFRIKKLHDKPHFVPLGHTQMDEIRSWAIADYKKTLGDNVTISLEDARKHGLASQVPFIKTAKNVGISPNYLRAQWYRWVKKQDALRDMDLNLHGLRATAIADRRQAGAPDGAISAELGMSVAMVSRYSRGADKATLARASRDRREELTKKCG